MFAATMIFTSLSDYLITKNSYLSSKNEMIDRDLKNYNKTLSENRAYGINYMKTDSENIIRPLTKEETELRSSDEVKKTLSELIFEDEINFDSIDEVTRRFYLRNSFMMLTIYLDREIRETKYTSISLIDFLDEQNAYLYLKCTPDEPDPLTDMNEDYNTAISYSDCFKSISYDISKHSAVKKILSGKAFKKSQTVDEVFNDDYGKDYYIGYTPVVINGKTICYLAIQYDWSDFHAELLSYVRNQIITGMIVLLILNILLMLFIYLKAISPIQKVTAGVMKYKENNDMTAVSEKMSSINVHNEIGTLADSFAEFAEEIDRHTNEIIKLNGEKQKIAAELSLATNIQSSMLPDKFPDRKEFDIFASMDPAKEVGGDFYDFFLIDEDHLAVVIADVSGKGVPAALFMMSSMILINDHVLMGGTPAEILERINNQICKTNKAHMFVTVWLGILEISTGKLTASSAGHEFPMINTNGKFELLKDKHGMPVGAFKKTKYKDYELTLKKGDIIFLYTDGVAEATNADNQLFGTDRTLDALNKNPDAAPEELLKNVRAAVDEFVKDAPQFDDLTMLGFKYFGKEENAD